MNLHRLGWSGDASSRAGTEQPSGRVAYVRKVTVALAAGAVTLGMAGVAAAQPVDGTWQDHVLGTGQSDLSPQSVTTTYGNVSNADSLAGAAGGTASLSWDGSGAAPIVVLDYGRVVTGLPYVDVSSVSGGAVGIRTAYSESLKYLLRPGAADLVTPSAAGDDTLKVSSVANLVTGQTVTVGAGTAAESRTISSVGTAATTNPAFAPIPAGATSVEVPSVAGYKVGQELFLGAGSAREVASVTSVGRASFSTSLVQSAAAGATNLKIEGNGQQCYEGYGCFGTPAFQVGDQVDVGGEDVTVTTVGTPGATGTGLGVTPLTADHASGTGVVFHGSGLGFTPAAAAPYPTGTPITYPGTGVQLSTPLDAAHDEGVKVTSSPGNVLGDAVQYVGTGVAGQRYRDTTVAVAGTVTTPANQLQGGIRYEAITLTTPGTITVSKVGVDKKFPNKSADKYAGSFLSSNDTLNDIWYTGAYTVDTNMAAAGDQNASTYPVIVDGAKRDRHIWIGDLFTSGRTLYNAFGYGPDGSDYQRNSLRVFGDTAQLSGAVNGDSGNWTLTPPQTSFYSTAYSMYYVVDLVDYFRYTGDVDFVRSQYSAMKNELAYNASLLNADGLVVTTAGNEGRDWDYYDGGKPGAVTATNVLYYRALHEAAWLADQLASSQPADSDTATWRADATAWSAKASATRAAINSKLYDSTRGVYKLSDRDNGTHAGTAVAQDANALAVLFGVAPADESTRVLAYLKSHLWGQHGPAPFSADAGYSSLISPFISGFETAARFQTGDGSDALALIDDVWAQMVDRANPFYSGAMWENYSADGTIQDPNTSLAHGWSSGPTWALSQYVLGVQPVDAGFSTWQVKPSTTGLAWSKGQVPTPHGAVGVSWAHDTSGLSLTVTAPAQTAGEIWVPIEHASDKTTGSTGATFLRHENGFDVYRVQSAGSYTFRSSDATKAASAVSLSLGAGVYGRPTTGQVQVRARGERAATGTVSIAVDGHPAGRYSLDGGAARFSLPSNLGAGVHRVTASYSGDASTAPSGTQGSVSVAKARTTTALRVATRHLMVDKTPATVVVRVVAPGADARVSTRGWVRLLVNGHTVKTVHLRGRLGQRVRVTLPSMHTRGTVRVRAVFAGDVNLVGSKSPVTTVRVAR